MESAHNSGVQMLHHFPFNHQELEGGMNKRGVPVHRDVKRAQMKKDDDAVNVEW